MPTRFALICVLLGLSFGACKKHAKLTPAPPSSPTPAPTVAAVSTPTPEPKTAKPAVDQKAQVIIFGYHQFLKNVRRPDTEITPEQFEQQMMTLKERGITVIGMQDFLAWKRGEKSIPLKSAVITIDDGYKSGYEVAWPILKKYGYPLTLFIYTEGVKGGHFGGGAAMSWEQLEEMRDAGVDIQAHSATHQDLRRPYDKVLKKRLSPPEYEAWLENEVAGSKKTLEQRLGIKVNCFAVPFGYYNGHVKEVAMKAGYEALFTVYGQRLAFGAPLDSLGRYVIENNKPKVFADAVNFNGGTSGGSVPIAEVSNTDLAAQPADGETVKTAKPLIKASTASLGEIDAGSFQMRISGLGPVPAAFDPKTQTVSYQVTQKLREKSCTVILSAKSGGKKVEAHWSFKIDDASAEAPAATPAPVTR